MNLSGQVILTKVVSGNEDVIDISHCKAGTYVWEVVTDKEIYMIKTVLLK
jgi:hypothetical protein